MSPKSNKYFKAKNSHTKTDKKIFDEYSDAKATRRVNSACIHFWGQNEY